MASLRFGVTRTESLEHKETVMAIRLVILMGKHVYIHAYMYIVPIAKKYSSKDVR